MLPYLQAALWWLVLLLIAVANAGLREALLVPLLGASLALPISGLLLSIWICLVAWCLVPRFVSLGSRGYAGIGGLWFTLTLLFELWFAYLGGVGWQSLLQPFNVSEGELFVAALLATLLAPWGAARLRGLV